MILKRNLILKHYINQEVLRTCASILMVLILIFISTRFIRYIQLAVDGSISSNAVFTLLGLQIPAVAGFLLPLSFFIAVLLTCGRLYAENEMAVIHGAGVSEFQLAKNIFPMAIILAVIAGCLSFWATPWSTYQTKSLLAKEKAEARFGAFSPGKFQESPSKSGVVFVESREKSGEVRGIFAVSGIRADSKQMEIQVANSAKFSRHSEKNAGASSDSDDEDNLVLENGNTYVFDKQLKQWKITQYDSYYMSVEGRQVQKIGLKSRLKPSRELLQNIGASEWAELHWRLSAPLSIPILCFLAIPLARSQPRKGKFSRFFPAIMVYLVYALLMMNGRRLIETGKIPGEIGFWWIHGLAVIFSVWLYHSKITRRRRKSRAANV